MQYYSDDNKVSLELSNKQIELHDLIKYYFMGKYADELMPEYEADIKKELRELINTRLLDSSKITRIIFQKLDIIEML